MVVDVVGVQSSEKNYPWAEGVWAGVETQLKDKIGVSIAPGRMQSFYESLTGLDNGFGVLAEEIWHDPHDPEKKQILGNANVMALDIADEMVRSLTSDVEDGITPEQKVSFYTKAMKSMGKIVGIQMALRNPEQVQLLADMQILTMKDWDDLQWEEAVFTDSPISQYVLQQEWLTREMWQQRDKNVGDTQEWLRGFCDHVANVIHIYDQKVGEKLYSADNVLERERDASGLAEVISSPIENALLFGSGNAQRVDGPMMDKLIEDGQVTHDAQIVALDMLAHPDMYPGISLIVGDLAAPNEAMKELYGKMQLITAIGSPDSNMSILAMRDYYLGMLAKFASKDAIFIWDDAVMEPVQDDNRRVRQTREVVENGGSVGQVPIQSAYRREGEDPYMVGAYIIPLMEKLMMAKKNGWECINLPEMGSSDWWELMHNIMDKDWIQEHTEQEPNAFKTPFYYAGEGVDGGIYRLTLMFKKVEPNHDLDLTVGMKEILLQRQSGPSPA